MVDGGSQCVGESDGKGGHGVVQFRGHSITELSGIGTLSCSIDSSSAWFITVIRTGTQQQVESVGGVLFAPYFAIASCATWRELVVGTPGV